MKTNELLEKEVQAALKWQPLLHNAKISVVAIDSVVVLTGTVDNYHKKIEAENTAKKVIGVKAVVEKIVINYSNCKIKSDSEITKKVIKTFGEKFDVPEEKIELTVEKGWITLDTNINCNSPKKIPISIFLECLETNKS